MRIANLRAQSFVLVLGAVLLQPAHAGIIANLDGRSLSTSFRTPTGQTLGRGDAGPDGLASFASTLSVEHAFGMATATQESVFNNIGVSGFGTAEGQGGQGLASQPRSTMLLVFTVPSKTTYVLTGSLMSAVITFTGPGTNDFERDTTGAPLPFSFGGTLDPGVYKIEALASVNTDSGELESARWDLSFSTMPAPGPIAAFTVAGLWLSRRRRGC